MRAILLAAVALVRSVPAGAQGQASQISWSQPSASVGRPSLATASRPSFSNPSGSQVRWSNPAESQVAWSNPAASDVKWSNPSTSAVAWSNPSGSHTNEPVMPPEPEAPSGREPPPPAPVAPDVAQFGRGGAGIGAILPEPPPVYFTMVVHGETYLMFDQVWYRPVPQGAETVYEVVRAPVGAALNELPPDCEPFQVSGSPAYHCPDELYVQETTSGYVVIDAPPARP